MESSIKIKHVFIEHVLAIDICSSPAYNKARGENLQNSTSSDSEKFYLLSVLREHFAFGDCQSYCIKCEPHFI